MKRLALAIVAMTACGAPPVQQDPIKPDVPPIRNTHIKIVVTQQFTYNFEDPEAGSLWSANFPKEVCAYLNELGREDGNTFALANGEPHNLTFAWTINWRGLERLSGYSGNLEFSGWGWGHITTRYGGESSGEDFFGDDFLGGVIHDLLHEAYTFLHEGWRDPRSRETRNTPSGRLTTHALSEYGIHVTTPEEYSWRAPAETPGLLAEWKSPDGQIYGWVRVETAGLSAKEFADRFETQQRASKDIANYRRLNEETYSGAGRGLWIVREVQGTWKGAEYHAFALFGSDGKYNVHLETASGEASWRACRDAIFTIVHGLRYEGPP